MHRTRLMVATLVLMPPILLLASCSTHKNGASKSATTSSTTQRTTTTEAPLPHVLSVCALLADTNLYTSIGSPKGQDRTPSAPLGYAAVLGQTNSECDYVATNDRLSVAVVGRFSAPHHLVQGPMHPDFISEKVDHLGSGADFGFSTPRAFLTAQSADDRWVVTIAALDGLAKTAREQRADYVDAMQLILRRLPDCSDLTKVVAGHHAGGCE